MRLTKPKIVGLATAVALLGAGLAATLIYFLLQKPKACAPCVPCKPCNCYAEGVGPWTLSSKQQ